MRGFEASRPGSRWEPDLARRAQGDVETGRRRWRSEKWRSGESGTSEKRGAPIVKGRVLAGIVWKDGMGEEQGAESSWEARILAPFGQAPARSQQSGASGPVAVLSAGLHSSTSALSSLSPVQRLLRAQIMTGMFIFSFCVPAV